MAQALSEGADPDCNADNTAGSRRIIYRAVENKDVQAAGILLNWGACPDARNDGKNPLLKSLRIKDESMSHLLLQAGAKFSLSEIEGVHYVTASRHTFRANEWEMALLESYNPELLPRISTKNPAGLKERLFKENHNHNAPLDNRETWKLFTHISKALMEQGNPITKDDFFDRNYHDTPWINVAVKFRQLDKVLDHLHSQGESLGVRDLLTENNEPTLLFDQIIACGGAKHIFTTRHMEGKSIADLRALFAVVPEQYKPEVGNYHSLASQMRRQQNQQERQR